MPCYRPLDAYIIAGRTENGKQIISFKREDNWKEPIKLPCGQCIGCKLLKSVNWAIRCEHEMSLHDANCFITLTYDEENLPKDYSLNKWHFEKFMKRFRKEISPKKIRYFMCGEYGDESWRPHYHAIIFGYDFPDKMRVQTQEVDNPYFLSAQLAKLWPFGHHMITNATFETAAYVARYCTKKITGDHAEEHYKKEIIDFCEFTGEVYSFIQTQLEPEYATMSRRPGIGKDWYKKYKTDCYPSDYLVRNGNKIPIPRYYDKLLEREEEVKLAQIKVSRKIKAMKNKCETTYDRLVAREHCKIKQAETLKRNKI
jgi:hypothetical protein